MIVDDEPIVGKRLKRLLEKDGHIISSFTRGSLAVQAMQDNTYDIVITDIKMGKVDGPKVLESAMNLNPGVRVVMISGLNEKRVSDEARKMGAYAVLIKPFKIEELRMLIKQAAETP